MDTKILMENKISFQELDMYSKSLISTFGNKAIVLLEGELGAGKTSFVKSFCRALNIKGTASPSFALNHQYEANNGLLVSHWDLYRLENEDELESSGFWDQFTEEQAIIFIEWSSRINEDYLPSGWPVYKMNFQLLDLDRRNVVLKKIK